MSISIDSKYNQVIDWNNTSTPYENDVCIHEKLEAQAIKNPEKDAISYKGNSLNYAELNALSNGVANILLDNNVKIEDYIIVHLNRGLELILSIFGILKAGGVYVPITPSTPKTRIESIIEDTKAKVVITTSEQKANLPIGNFQIIIIDNIIDKLNTLNKSQPEVDVNSTNLAYAIFTSGTTGKPKGVLIEHRSVLNRIGWMQKAYPINSDDILIQKTPISFDVSVWELFWWTFVGAKLVLLENGHEKEPLKLLECIKNEKVSVIHFVPSMLNTFIMSLNSLPTAQLSQLSSLKWLFCSGEELHTESVSEFYRICNEYNLDTTIINLYGPTEATVDVTFYTCPRDLFGPIPIGKPIDNTEIYIINERNEILQPEEQGELVICGVNLARGYLRRPEITSEKFITLRKPNGENVNAYKTGDYAYYNNAGNIIYKGRIDGQIKLRGFRVELAEIENSILTFNGVGECACLLNNRGQDSAYIIAFIVPNDSLDNSELCCFLKKTLPDYMLPSKFEIIKQLPLSANGKLDRNKLLYDFENADSKDDSLSSISDYERALQKIWAKLFKKPNISPIANFFDIGGNSLLIVQLSLILKKELNREIDVITLMQFTSIRLLAEHLVGFED